MPESNAVEETVPETIQLIRPQPLLTRAVRHKNAAGWVTAIYREWKAGESQFCRLCPRGTCCAEQDGCLIMVEGYIGPSETSQFSTAAIPGFRWDDTRVGITAGVDPSA